jgi:hypothetical protein
LARVFAHSPDKMPRLVPELDLAGMIAAVLSHPDLPPALWDGFTDAINEVNNSTDILKRPDFFRALLDVCAASGKGGAA